MPKRLHLKRFYRDYPHVIRSHAILEATRRIGGQMRLAELLGVSQPNVSRWVHRGCVPTKYVNLVEALTGMPRKFLQPELSGEGFPDLRRIAAEPPKVHEQPSA